jgi:hypothetical protein
LLARRAGGNIPYHSKYIHLIRIPPAEGYGGKEGRQRTQPSLIDTVAARCQWEDENVIKTVEMGHPPDFAAWARQDA